MFGKSKNENSGSNNSRIAELEAQLAEAKYLADRNYRMLQSVNNSTHLGIWMAYYDENGEQAGVHFSSEFRRMLGYTMEELPDTFDSLGRIIHPDDMDMVFGAYGAALADKSKQYLVDYRLLCKDGQYRYFHAAGECVRRKNGVPEVFIGTFTDIEDKLRTEEELTQSLRRSGAVELMMLEGSWSMDLTKYDISDINSPMVFNDQFKRILGYTNSYDFPDIMNSWITKIHPDDVAMASEKMGEQLSDPTGSVVFDMEYRMLHKNGQYIWLRSSSHVVWSDDKTKPLMAAGTILDITAEKNNKTRFQEEMEPNIQNLRKGITDIAKTVDTAAKQMNEIAARQVDVTESAKKIEDAVADSMSIINSIQSIANQTNLLSLNASIEAARAGEAGRGFAVVAGEVQNLSTSTKETTNKIADILNGMRNCVNEMLEKIALISENVTDESAEMQEIDATITSLHKAADEVADMAAKLYN